MKLASVQHEGTATWGLVQGREILDVGAVLRPAYEDLRSLIAGSAWAEVAAAVPLAGRIALEELEWLPVIPNPGKVLCVGLNYESHRRETGRAQVEHPTIFIRFADSQTGHLQDLLRPRVSEQLDYEGELAVIIGKPGRYIPVGRAHEHIAGYTCYNDATVRDWQRHTQQFTPGKNFPATGACGPWMVTADEIPDVAALELVTRVNGSAVQQASLDELIFPIGRLIEYCSAFTPLAPGDVIATGTPGGVGFKRTPPSFLRPGDRVEVEISGVGLLRNTISDAP